jgi:hypothetical protein
MTPHHKSFIIKKSTLFSLIFLHQILKIDNNINKSDNINSQSNHCILFSKFCGWAFLDQFVVFISILLSSSGIPQSSDLGPLLFTLLNMDDDCVNQKLKETTFW